MRMRRRRRVPALNTTSTADISFMLLVFFLVTTSLDQDKGIARQMAPAPDTEEEQLRVDDDDLLRVVIDADDLLTCEGEAVTLAALTERVERMAEANPEEHVVAISVDREASYEAYFGVEDAVLAAYRHVRDKEAMRRYGKAFKDCDNSEKEAIAKSHPQRISEGGAQ